MAGEERGKELVNVVLSIAGKPWTTVTAPYGIPEIKAQFIPPEPVPLGDREPPVQSPIFVFVFHRAGDRHYELVTIYNSEATKIELVITYNLKGGEESV